jgi:hypothetical protein
LPATSALVGSNTRSFLEHCSRPFGAVFVVIGNQKLTVEVAGHSHGLPANLRH